MTNPTANPNDEGAARRRWRWCALALVLGTAAGAAWAGAKGAGPSMADLGVPMVYTFAPVKPCPGYETSLLALRNERKLRPLFITGRGAPVAPKSPDGRLTVTFINPNDIGSILEHGGTGGPPDAATARGRFAVRFTRYSHGEADLQRTVGTEWLGRTERPEIVLAVERVTQFKAAEDRHGHPIPETYDVLVQGKLEAAGRSVAVKVPARATFIEAVPSKGIRPSLRLDLEFTFQGADLGLTGDDAGDLRAEVSTVGFTDFGEVRQDLLERMQLPGL